MFEELGKFSIGPFVMEELSSFTKLFWKTLTCFHPKYLEKASLKPHTSTENIPSRL